jgi:hypothetical protein
MMIFSPLFSKLKTPYDEIKSKEQLDYLLLRIQVPPTYISQNDR